MVELFCTLLCEAAILGVLPARLGVEPTVTSELLVEADGVEHLVSGLSAVVSTPVGRVWSLGEVFTACWGAAVVTSELYPAGLEVEPTGTPSTGRGAVGPCTEVDGVVGLCTVTRGVTEACADLVEPLATCAKVLLVFG